MGTIIKENTWIRNIVAPEVDIFYIDVEHEALFRRNITKIFNNIRYLERGIENVISMLENRYGLRLKERLVGRPRTVFNGSEEKTIYNLRLMPKWETMDEAINMLLEEKAGLKYLLDIQLTDNEESMPKENLNLVNLFQERYGDDKFLIKKSLSCGICFDELGSGRGCI